VARITARIDRLALGNPGDVKPVGAGVSEMRVDYGPGYRIYYQQRGSLMVLLLCGGDKRTQDADIKQAIKLAGDWQQQSKANPTARLWHPCVDVYVSNRGRRWWLGAIATALVVSLAALLLRPMLEHGCVRGSSPRPCAMAQLPESVWYTSASGRCCDWRDSIST
jgi:putative addiction module killer protein